ncbi:MAG: alpha/beta hydrolase [Ignavibacteriales bacterium]|nr:alpha/beta hydrolase [Ignavibacteriales bacterium]
MHSKTLSFCWLFALFIISGCDLDPYLFNTKKVDSYQVSDVVIPVAKRDFISFKSQGKTLYGFYIYSDSSSQQTKDWTILYFHGNKHNLAEYWDRVELMYRAGYSVLIFDYQQFGMSEGTASESALYADAQAAYDYLMSNHPTLTNHIIYYGYSLGCAAAVNLAVSNTPGRLILEAPFASGEALVQSGTLLDIPGEFLLKGEFNNKEKIKSIHTPLTILHGTDDSFIDMNKNGKVIYENGNNPKKFIPVSGANHTNIPEKMRIDVYIAFLLDII